MTRVLLLGGTGEARRLATALVGRPDIWVVTSLAGLVTTPALPPGDVRVGGFGGVEALAGWLRAERIDAVVDATHPFAATITSAAIRATAAVGVPLVVVRRPGWLAVPGDDWRRVGSVAAAAALVPSLGERVLLTVGRRGLDAFAGIDACWFLVRSVDPPSPPLPRRAEVVLDRGPFTLDGERALLAAHRIQVVVTKDSGGAMTAAKLVAARERRVPVVVIDRPPAPELAAPVETVQTVEAALDWLAQHRSGGLTGPV
jgi:precorrin-6A/cobalt-precorrin-6A reductase